MFLGESLDHSKLANTITTEWKETLESTIDDEIKTKPVQNWLEVPRWLRGSIYSLPIDKLKKKFEEQSHYENDLCIGLISGTFLIDYDIASDENLPKAVIVRAKLGPDQEK